MITFAKGVTSGTVPMGGVIVRKPIYDAFMQGPEHAIELFHGYTYSGHPLACAAALATLDLYRDERLFERAKALEPKWCDAIMSLKGLPNVVDIRCVGLNRRDRPAPIPGSPGAARLSRARPLVLRGGDHAAPVRRHDRADPAAHREREPDRRDHGEGRRVDQSGGLRGGERFPSPQRVRAELDPRPL